MFSHISPNVAFFYALKIQEPIMGQVMTSQKEHLIGPPV